MLQKKDSSHTSQPFLCEKLNTSTNNANQQVVDNIDLTKKQMQIINRTTKNLLKVESKEIVHEEFLPYESIIINHRN